MPLRWTRTAAPPAAVLVAGSAAAPEPLRRVLAREGRSPRPLVTGPEVVLLHAYKKQRQKAPGKEIETAERRMEEVLAQGSR